jgi:sirohydrochlorin cobaltochelatase
MTTQQIACILVGHGSIHSDSGKAMIRIAARLREQGVAPIVEAGFLNYNEPTLAAAVQKVKRQGATAVIVQPYFLIDGQYASQDLPTLVQAVAADEPGLPFTIAATLGYHASLVRLAAKRILAADPQPAATTALLLVAHGTPLTAANAPIMRVAQEIGAQLGYGATAVAYLDCNQPTIPAAIDQFATAGYQRLVIQPYFLHLGRHVRTDLPDLFAAAGARHPQLALIAAHHLDYDPLLVDVTADRMRACQVDTHIVAGNM